MVLDLFAINFSYLTVCFLFLVWWLIILGASTGGDGLTKLIKKCWIKLNGLIMTKLSTFPSQDW